MDTECVFKRFPMDDHGYTSLEDLFPDSFKFLREALKSGESSKVLIHCKSGINRSTTLAIGFLMDLKGMNLKDAYTLVKNKRPQTCPHDSYAKQLIEYDELKFGKASIKYEEMETTMQLCARLAAEDDEDSDSDEEDLDKHEENGAGEKNQNKGKENGCAIQ